MGVEEQATHEAPATASEGDADFPRVSPATDDTASPNVRPKEATHAKDRALGISLKSPICSIPGRREAANSDASSPPATKSRTQAQHNKHEGTLEIPNNEVGTPANTNLYVPLYAASASVDVAEAAEEKN